MKKTSLLLTLASSFILASCGATETSTESNPGESVSQSESVLNSESSSIIEGTPIKGDTSRTYLNNALETSFKKKGYSINISNFKAESSTREYAVGNPVQAGSDEHVLTKTNNTEGYSVSSPEVVWTNVGRESTNHSQLGGYFGIKDATYIATENGTQKSKEEHQYSNIYLKDNKYYYDYLNDQGVETPGMSDKINDLVEDIISLIGDEADFTMGTKGYIDASDEEISEILDYLMPKTSFAEFLPTIADALFDNLTDVEGVEFTYEGLKAADDKYYTTTIHITDPSAIFEGIRNMIDNLPDIIDDVIGEDFSKDDILEILDEIEISSDEVKKFDLSVVLNYTPNYLRTVDYILEYEAKDTNRTITIDPEDEEPAEFLDIVEKLSVSGNASFTFSDNMTITYPSFVDYQKVNLNM